MIERLAYFIEFEKISVRAFEQKIGTSNGLIRKAISNNTDIQSKWIQTIIDNFPQLNIEWLFTGKGSMLKDQPDALLLADPQVLYGRQNDEIKNLREQVKVYKKELENKQKIIDSQLKTIDEQNEQIRAYRTGRIVNTDGADTHAPKRGAG